MSAAQDHFAPATGLTTKQIGDELDVLEQKFRDMREGLEGMSGSPGEWMVERMGELETELGRRKRAGTST
jgi:hypothetical protein